MTYSSFFCLYLTISSSKERVCSSQCRSVKPLTSFMKSMKKLRQSSPSRLSVTLLYKLCLRDYSFEIRTSRISYKPTSIGLILSVASSQQIRENESRMIVCLYSRLLYFTSSSFSNCGTSSILIVQVILSVDSRLIVRAKSCSNRCLSQKRQRTFCRVLSKSSKSLNHNYSMIVLIHMVSNL